VIPRDRGAGREFVIAFATLRAGVSAAAETADGHCLSVSSRKPSHGG
jgi:hypothetical protein